MDIVHEILERVRARIAEAYGLPEEVADIIGLVEREAKIEFGGQRVTVSPPRADPERKAAAITRDYLSGADVDDVASRHGISRRTMYRYLKRR